MCIYIHRGSNDVLIPSNCPFLSRHARCPLKISLAQAFGLPPLQRNDGTQLLSETLSILHPPT